MFNRIINLPFKVIGRAARTLQERNDAAMKEKHGTGDESYTFEHLGALPEVDLPDGFDPASVDKAAKDVRKVAAERTVVYVDMRDHDGWNEGHIPGALHMPRGDLNIRIAEFPPDTPVFFYDDEDHPGLARKGAIFSRDRGIDVSWAIKGGISAWQKAGGKLTRD